MRYFLTTFILVLFFSNFVEAQIVEKDYQFVLSLDNGLDRKMYANELMVDESQQYLIVNYGNKPTYIVVFEFGLWHPVVSFRLANWVEFSGSYVDYDKNDLYIKASRYSSEYYKLNINNGDQEIRECESLPDGCPVIEPKQADKSVFSKDKAFYFTVNKKNARDVRVYQKR